MDLPQTDAGIPAAGIDPSTQELAAISSIADIFDWLGTAEPTRAAFIAAMGGGQFKIRDLGLHQASRMGPGRCRHSGPSRERATS